MSVGFNVWQQPQVAIRGTAALGQSHYRLCIHAANTKL